jgi:sec-independent protein translocase protein TatB
VDILGIGPMELILILIVALMVFGPERLPQIGAKLGRAMRDMRRATRAISDEINATRAAIETPARELVEPFQDVADAAKAVGGVAAAARNPGQALRDSIMRELNPPPQAETAAATPAAEENTIAPPSALPAPAEPPSTLPESEPGEAVAAPPVDEEPLAELPAPEQPVAALEQPVAGLPAPEDASAPPAADSSIDDGERTPPSTAQDSPASTPPEQ